MVAVGVRGISVEDFVLSHMSGHTDAGLIVFGFGILKEVNYADELEESGVFYDLALLSSDLSCPVVAACETALAGTVRKSAAVFDCGRVLGVSDMNHTIAKAKYRAGFGYRVYATSRGNIGVVVDEDAMFPESFLTVSRACADYAVCLADAIDTERYQVALRSAAVANGLSVLSQSRSRTGVYQVAGGEPALYEEEVSRVEFVPQCVYNEMTVKHRGMIL